VVETEKVFADGLRVDLFTGLDLSRAALLGSLRLRA
jgi:hypothetical protein